MDLLRSSQINLDQLVTFYFVAKERSLSRASEKLCVTAPAVTMQIKALERYFHVKLIYLKKKRIFLTMAGNILFPYAEEIYRSSIKAEHFLLSYRNNLRLGITPALTGRFISVVDQFKEVHQTIGVTLRQGPSQRLIEELLEFQHDLCIVAAYGKLSDELLSFRLPQPEKMLLVVSPGAPLGKKNEVGWEDLNHYPTVIHCEGSFSRQVILEEFQKRNIKPSIAASVDSIEGMKALIQQGVGAAFMLTCNIEQEVALKKLKVVALRDGEIELPVAIVLHRGVNVLPPAKAFLRLLSDRFSCKLSMD